MGATFWGLLELGRLKVEVVQPLTVELLDLEVLIVVLSRKLR